MNYYKPDYTLGRRFTMTYRLRHSPTVKQSISGRFIGDENGVIAEFMKSERSLHFALEVESGEKLPFIPPYDFVVKFKEAEK